MCDIVAGDSAANPRAAAFLGSQPLSGANHRPSTPTRRYFFTQHHITPFLGYAKPFSFDAKYLANTQVPGPFADGAASPKTRALLKAETDRVRLGSV
jgi:hypothetical protein